MNRSRAFFVLFGLLMAFPSMGWAGAVITYHGRILNQVGHPIQGNISFRIRIYSPIPGKCLLYEETRNLTLGSDAQGVFVIPIGDGAAPRTGEDPGLTMEKIFANNGVKIPGLKCNSSDYYTPQSLDQRVMEVSFDDHTGYGWDNLPPMTLSYVPFAVNAHDSTKVGGVAAQSVLKVVDPDPLNSAFDAAPLTPGNFTELLALLNGTSTQFEKVNQLRGTTVPILSDGQVLGWSGSGWAAITPETPEAESDPTVKGFAKEDLPVCGDNQFLKDNGSGKLICVTATDSGGTLTSIAAGSGLLTDQSGNAAITTSGALSVDAGTGVGQVLQFTTAETLPTLDGSNLTNVTAEGLSTTAAITSGGHTVAGDILVNNGNITATGDGVSTGKILAPLISGTSMSAKDLGVNNLFVRSPADHATNGIYITAPTANVTAPYTLKLPQALPSSSMVLGSDASGQLTWISPSTGSVTGVTAGAPLAVDSSTPATPKISLSPGTAANQVLTWDGSNWAPAAVPAPGGTAGGDLGGTYPNPTVDGLQGRAVAVTAPSEGQALLWDNDGNTWTPQFVRMQDIRTAWGGTQMIPSAVCTAKQSMVWSVVTDRFICQNIGSLDASAISGGVLDATRLPEASGTVKGIVNLAAQSFAGLKTFLNGLSVTGDISATGSVTAASLSTTGAVSASNISVGSDEVKLVNLAQVCDATNEGAIKYNKTTKKLEFCNGSAWLTVTLDDPCTKNNPPLGTVCSSGAIWLGEFPTSISHAGNNGGKTKYMMMPSGCDGTTSNPSCSGPDMTAINRYWNDGASNWGSSGVEVVGDSNIKPTALGDTDTATLAAATAPGGGVYEAAKYCSDLVYGGYDDWYLPNKSELAYIYCKAQPGATHNINYPAEEPNCGGDYGGKESILTGFANAYYWSVTEYNTSSVWVQNFGSGYQAGNFSKTNNFRVRCLRRL